MAYILIIKKDIKKRQSIEGVGGVRRQLGDVRTPKTSCIVCKKPARASSIYCSDSCILKHAQDSLGAQASASKMDEPGREKLKPESRVRNSVFRMPYMYGPMREPYYSDYAVRLSCLNFRGLSETASWNFHWVCIMYGGLIYVTKSNFN